MQVDYGMKYNFISNRQCNTNVIKSDRRLIDFKLEAQIPSFKILTSR